MFSTGKTPKLSNPTPSHGGWSVAEAVGVVAGVAGAAEVAEVAAAVVANN
jgi:hypothetical protein